MRRTLGARNTARERRWLVVVVLAFVFALATRAAHQIAVPHRLCQLHGTIEHGSPADSAADAHASSHGPSVVPGDGPHEECEIAAVTRHEELAPLPTPPVTVGDLEPRGTCPLPGRRKPGSRSPRDVRGRSPPA